METFPARLRLTIHHEAHEGHEERRTGLEKRSDPSTEFILSEAEGLRTGYNMILSSFALFESFVVEYSGSLARFESRLNETNPE